MYWIYLLESVLLTVYVCVLHRQTFAIAWDLANARWRWASKSSFINNRHIQELSCDKTRSN